MVNYDDVLPSKYGNEDNAFTRGFGGAAYDDGTPLRTVGFVNHDVTAALGGFAQAEYQRKRLEAAQKAWKAVENQIRLRTDQCLREALAEAKCAVYDAMHLPGFDYKVAALKEDAANLTLISSRYL